MGENTYSGYEHDLAIMHRAQADKSETCKLCEVEFVLGCTHYCRRCGNSGFYRCKQLASCEATQFYLLPADAKHFHDAAGVAVDGRHKIPYPHTHLCGCIPSGGVIRAKLREIKMREVRA